MQMRNVAKNTIPVTKLEMADTFSRRFLGLMGRRSMDPGRGLLITPCNSIHMLFMRFPIDAVFLDREKNVVHICEGIKPWRVSRLIKKARSVLELPSGTVRSAEIEIGDRLEIC